MFVANAKPVIKKLIEHNSNNLKKNGKEEKEAIDIEFIEQKTNTENNENTIDFKCSDNQEKTWSTLIRQTWLRS